MIYLLNLIMFDFIANDVEKTCKSCRVTKPLSEFYPRKNGKSEVTAHCKICKPSTSYPSHKIRKESRQLLRVEVLRIYGGKCNCCGEAEQQFLQIDHINNDGYKHRREILKGRPIYEWLKMMGFPKDEFQLLCANCNYSKRLNNGVCIHKLLDKDNLI